MLKNDFKAKGFTLVEMLVVIALFAGLAVLVGSMVGSSMKGTKKSESAMKVRAELENAVSIFERSLRGAKKGSVNCSSNTAISFIDQDELNTTFVCSGSPPVLKKNYIDLVGPDLSLTKCEINCDDLLNGTVVINLEGTSKNSSIGVEADIATVSAKVILRNY